MSITCQVTQQARDTLRLSAPGIATQPETHTLLMQILLAVPGVEGVELQPASDSILVRHNGTPAARNAVMQALRSGAAPAAAQAAPSQAEASPYARCEIVHAMRGRVRLHLPRAGSDAVLAGVLAAHLGEQPGVRNVRLNRRAANVIAAYDPAVLDAKAIVAMVTAYAPDAAAVAHWKAAQRARVAPSIQHGRRRTFEIAAAAVALALTFFAGAAAAWVVYALLLGCVVSIAQRTYKTLRVDRKLVVDAAGAAAMVAAGLLGALWVAALIPLVLFGAPRLYTWAQTHADSPRVASGVASRRTARRAMRAVAALPQYSSMLRLDQVLASEPVPVRAAAEQPEPVPVRSTAAKTAEPRQVVVDVSASSAASYSSTTWVVQSESHPFTHKA